MNLGIFAKTFRRETVSEIFVAASSMREATVEPLPRLIRIDLRLVVSPTTFACSSTT